MDTQQQNFWVESIQKEATLRFAWQLRYSKQFAKDAAAKKQKELQQSKLKKTGLQLQSDIGEKIKRLEQQVDTENKQEGKKSSKPASRCSSSQKQSVSLRDMRPASVATRNMLYNGISAHGEGRYAYLKKRKALTPEQKFEFPVLSSCQYGWKIMDFMDPNSKPSPHARTCVIRDSFYRNSGIIIG